ncbi:MAG: glycosyltransferase [Parcubacteria group bacterium]
MQMSVDTVMDGAVHNAFFKNKNQKGMKILFVPYKMGEKYNYIPPDRPSSDLSVIVVTKYASPALEKCLNSLFRNSYFSNEIIIVCNNPSWQTVKVLQERHLQYWVVPFEHAFIAANFAAELATKKYVSFIGDDMVVGPGWDAAALSIADDGILGSLAFINGVEIQNEHYQIGNSGIFGGNIASEIGYDKETRYVDDQKFDAWCKKNSSNRIEEFYWPPSVHNRLDLLKDRFCFHMPHGVGHEIAFENRHKRDGWKVKTTYRSFIYHVGAAGNRDGLPGEYCVGQLSNGVWICASCGIHIEGINRDHPDNVLVHQAGYWLCEECRKKVDWSPIPHRRF